MPNTATRGCTQLNSLSTTVHTPEKKPGRKEDKTLAELAKQFGLHPNQITDWKRQLLEHAAEALGGGAAPAEPVDLGPLHATIGQQALELDFLNGALTKARLLSAKR